MRDVKAMSERDLAEYQSGYKTSSAEWKVCEEEFERKARHAGDASVVGSDLDFSGRARAHCA